jgi:hypothetical protein
VAHENHSQVVSRTPSARPGFNNEAVAALAGVRAQRGPHAVAGINEVHRMEMAMEQEIRLVMIGDYNDK